MTWRVLRSALKPRRLSRAARRDERSSWLDRRQTRKPLRLLPRRGALLARRVGRARSKECGREGARGLISRRLEAVGPSADGERGKGFAAKRGHGVARSALLLDPPLARG